MTRSTISASLREALVAQDSDVIVLAFLTVTHPELSGPLRFVSDGVDYVRGGETWTGLPFDIKILDDTDSPPKATIEIPNVDRIIGEAVLGMGNEPARIMIELLSSEDFDIEAEPRQEIGTAHVNYRAAGLFLVNVTVDVTKVSGTLKSWDYTQEVVPAISATRDILPGLFR